MNETLIGYIRTPFDLEETEGDDKVVPLKKAVEKHVRPMAIIIEAVSLI